MEQSPSWEANSSSAAQEIPRILWNSKVHHRIHNSPPPVPVLSQIEPVRALLPTHVSKIYFNIILPSMSPSSKSFLPLGSPLKFCMHLYYPSFVLHALPIPTQRINPSHISCWAVANFAKVFQLSFGSDKQEVLLGGITAESEAQDAQKTQNVHILSVWWCV